MNKLEVIRTIDQVFEWKDFFLEGLKSLNDPHGARGDMTVDRFLKTLIFAVSLPPDRALVEVLTSKNRKPLGYGIGFENTPRFSTDRTFLAFATYTNGLSANAAQELLTSAERWARFHGYKKIEACSRRMSGAATRLFERKWQFERECIVWKKDL